MTLSQAAAVFFAAMLGGAINAVAGGGSFVTLPTLLFVGVPAVMANATSTVGLWPASVAAAAAYRKDLPARRGLLLTLGVASVAGGALGAFVLLRTSDSTFVHLLPWLLLVATVLLTVGGRKKAAAPARAAGSEGATEAFPVGLVLGGVAQLVIAAYGGYFGGGMGILMLASFAALGMGNIHAMNGLKSVLGALINGAAVIAFLAARAVDVRTGLVMVCGGLLGGWFGARAARRIAPARVKTGVLILAWAMTAYFFLRSA